MVEGIEIFRFRTGKAPMIQLVDLVFESIFIDSGRVSSVRMIRCCLPCAKADPFRDVIWLNFTKNLKSNFLESQLASRLALSLDFMALLTFLRVVLEQSVCGWQAAVHLGNKSEISGLVFANLINAVGLNFLIEWKAEEEAISHDFDLDMSSSFIWLAL